METIEIPEEMLKYGYNSVPELLTDIKAAKDAPGGLKGYADSKGFDISKIMDYGKALDAWVAIPENAEKLDDETLDTIQEIIDMAPLGFGDAFVEKNFPNLAALLNDDEEKPEPPKEPRYKMPLPRSAMNDEITMMYSDGYCPTEIKQILEDKYDRDILPAYITKIIHEAERKRKEEEKLNNPVPVTLPQDNGLHILPRAFGWVKRNIL